jgi:small-conductance mechanosensitive channel
MDSEFRNIFVQFFSEVKALTPKIIIGIIVIVIFVILGKLFYGIIGKRIQRRWKDSIISNFISEAAKWSFYIFGIIIALNILGFGGIASSLIAGAGIGAIIIGFAFKDIAENFLAGIILALKRPFDIGDIIEVDGHKGSVKDLDLRLTHLRNSEGKDIYIPNSAIIKNTLINYTKDGNLRVNFMVGIAPECDINHTRSLIMGYLEQNDQILQNPSPNVIVQELGEFTTDMQVLFWVDILANKTLPDGNLGHSIRSKAITEIKAILDQNNIEMPSQVVEHKMYRDNQFAVKKDS